MNPQPDRMPHILLACLILTMLGCSSGSGDGSLPEANTENCKPENINKINNKAAREAFASKCFRRGKFEPSPNKTW